MTTRYLTVDETTGKQQLGRNVNLSIVYKDTTYSIVNSDDTIVCTANSFTVTLPTAVGIEGKPFTIKNIGAGTVSVQTTSSQTIDGNSPPVTLENGEWLTVQAANSNWIML